MNTDSTGSLYVRCLMMMSLKTRFLSFLAAFLFLSAVSTVAELVDSISDCDQFLLDRTSPQVPGVLEGGNILNQNRFKTICQTFQNQRRFVTLYDLKNKIPVFSAYKYRGAGRARRPQNWWKIEPQLESEDDKNMVVGDRNKTYNNQAGDADYRKNGAFDRGHLFPSSYGFNKSDKMSTFTLTNIVPQADSFNQGSWKRMEKCIKCVMDRFCVNNNGVIEGFVVTGAQPSANNMLRNRINIPSMLWSAFCCYSSSMEMWIASAHLGENVRDESKSKYLQTRTLEKLHEELRRADSEFKVFPGSKCPQLTTVTEFYPELNKTCDCPPSFSNTSAPATSTSAPLTSTSAPLTSTSAPLTSTSAPAASTSAPLTSTSSPLFSTPDPLTTTSAPLTSTSALLTSTSAPLTSRSAPPISTSAPLTSTSAPLFFTPDPLTSTSAPLSSTSAPLTSASAPLFSTSGSFTSISAASTYTSAPLTTTSAPLTTTSAPLTSSSAPLTSTSAPLTSSSAPLTSTSASLTSSSAPLTSSSAPLTSTSASLTSTSAPLTSTSASLTSSSAPPTSSSIPPTSTSGSHTATPVAPTITTYHPKTWFGPLMSTSGPQTTTSTSVPLTTTSGPVTSTSGQLTSTPFT